MLLRCKAVKYDPDKAIALRSMGRWWYTNQFGALGLVDSIIHAINPNTHSVGGVETRAVRCARKERGWTRAEYKRIQHEDRWLEWDGQRKADNGPHGRIQ